jgi:membrane protein DedA with SNARE-associated domain
LLSEIHSAGALPQCSIRSFLLSQWQLSIQFRRSDTSAFWDSWLPFAGYLASTGQFSLLGAATIGALGCNLGSTIAYYVAAKGGRKAIEHCGTYVLIRPSDIEHAERFFARHGAAAVLISRLLPVVRTFISVPAGLARMPMLKFQLYTFAGSWPWCFGLAYVGFVLGKNWDTNPILRSMMHRLDFIVVFAVIAAAAWFFWTRLDKGQS